MRQTLIISLIIILLKFAQMFFVMFSAHSFFFFFLGWEGVGGENYYWRSPSPITAWLCFVCVLIFQSNQPSLRGFVFVFWGWLTARPCVLLERAATGTCLVSGVDELDTFVGHWEYDGWHFLHLFRRLLRIRREVSAMSEKFHVNKQEQNWSHLE